MFLNLQLELVAYLIQCGSNIEKFILISLWLEVLNLNF